MTNVKTVLRGLRARACQRLAILALLALGLAVAPVGTAHAQVLYGSITGNVTDPQGGTIPGAAVTITNKATNATREGVSNEEGVYTVPNLTPGNYDVKVTLRASANSSRRVSP